MPIYHISLRSILILFSHLRIYLTNGLPSFWVPTKKRLYQFLFSTMPATCPSYPSLIGHSKYISRRVQVMKLLFTQFSPTSCYFIPLISKCSQHTLFSNTLNLHSSISTKRLNHLCSQLYPTGLYYIRDILHVSATYKQTTGIS
jgi:hypothetical protein